MENDLCSDDPWLVLHKIDSPTKMRYIGNRVQGCNFSDAEPPEKVAPSIEPFIKQKGAHSSYHLLYFPISLWYLLCLFEGFMWLL